MKLRYYYWISVALLAVLLVTPGDGQVSPETDLDLSRSGMSWICSPCATV